MKDINIVLFYCSTRTGHFGQGTFVRTVLSIFRKHSFIKVSIIKTDQIDISEVTRITEDDIEQLLIPRPENKLTLNTVDNYIQSKYAERVLDICADFLKSKENLIFWINSIDYLNIAKLLKTYFSNSKLFYVHHAWSWKHFKNISDEKFANEWLKQNIAFSPEASEFTSYQWQIASIADQVVTVTKSAALFFENVLKIPNHKISTIYNGINFSNIKVFDQVAIRAKYGFSPEEKIVLYSGRVTLEKGLPFLLKAFTIIADKFEDVRLVVIGKGMIQDYIALAAPYWGKVTYAGELSEEQVHEFYSIADIGIQPSLFDQCSFTAIEMCYHKLPMVVSSDIGLVEMFDESSALMVDVSYNNDGVKYLDHRQIADKIEYLLLNPDAARIMGENSYRKTELIFNTINMEKNYINLIQSLITNN